MVPFPTYCGKKALSAVFLLSFFKCGYILRCTQIPSVFSPLLCTLLLYLMVMIGASYFLPSVSQSGCGFVQILWLNTMPSQPGFFATLRTTCKVRGRPCSAVFSSVCPDLSLATVPCLSVKCLAEKCVREGSGKVLCTQKRMFYITEPIGPSGTLVDFGL